MGGGQVLLLRQLLKGSQWLERRAGQGAHSLVRFCSRQDPALWPRLAVNLKDHPASASLVLGFVRSHAPLPSSAVLLNGRSAVAFKASGRESMPFGLCQTLIPIL